MKNAFEAAFGFERNRNIWATIGIFPFDRNCLRDNKVKHEVLTLEDGTIDVDTDPLATKLLSIEEFNKIETSLLDLHRLNGSAFKKTAPRLDLTRSKTAVTIAQSRERQDLLMNASSAGKQFHATRGEFLNSDDYFISQERKQRHLKLQDLSNKKKVYIDCINQEIEGKSVIENFQTVKYKDAVNIHLLLIT